MMSKNGNVDNKKMKKNNHHPNREDGNNHKKGNGSSKKIITDTRFASVHSDPRFQKVPKHESKVAIDSRFNRIFTDKRFASSSAPLDKRGKPKKINNSENSLRYYYQIEEEKEEEKRENQPAAKIGGDVSETESSGESDVSVSEDAVESDESETSGDTDDDEDEVSYEDDEPEAPEEKILEIEKETHRLAVVNMDWRYVKAVDLYMMLSSFLPKEGQINSVSVYPSEFGLQRMKEEELHGPVGLFDDENENNDENDDEIDHEKLRDYEKSRLRYYYAVVECDSIATADYLYKACDGVEFERSSNVLDLRFIPDSMEFRHPPRDIAKEAPSNYEGLDFHTQALQQSKVQLSWDDDEPDRVKTLKRKFTADQLAELELKEFLASDEGESDDDDKHAEEGGGSENKTKKRDIYRTLLQSGDGSDREDGEGGQEMEVTFNPGLEDISNRILKKKDNEEETVWNATLRKMREKRKARKNRSKHSSDDDSSDADQAAMEEQDDFFIEEPLVKKSKKESQGKGVKADKQREDVDRQAEASRQELELLLAEDNGADTGLKGYNLKPKKVKGKKGKKVKEILEEDKIPSVHYDDPRFSALFKSPLFALDPTDPQFKRSAAYARQLAMKQQKIEEKELGKGERTKLSGNVANGMDQVKSSNDLQAKKDKYELSSLVKSVKMKSKQVQIPSIGKRTKKR